MRTIQIPRRFVRSEWGGTETVVWETSRRLIARGHPTTVICPIALTYKECEIVGGVPVRRVSYFYPYVGLTAEAQQQLHTQVRQQHPERVDEHPPSIALGLRIINTITILASITDLLIIIISSCSRAAKLHAVGLDVGGHE